MTTDDYTLCEIQNDLNKKLDMLIESRNRYSLIRDSYRLKNEINEMKMRRLLQLKGQLEYVKDMFLREKHKSYVDAETRKIFLNGRLRYYQKNNEIIKLEHLPAVLQLQELKQNNENLTFQYAKLSEIVGKIKKEYLQLLSIFKNNLIEKIVEYSYKYVEIRKFYRNCIFNSVT